jgi:signal transduction histidine kinase
MSQAAVAVEAPTSPQNFTASVETVDLVRNIAHELRQPLSTIESIAYYLDLVLPREDGKIREQLAKLQQLVNQSNWIVSNAIYLTQPAAPVLQSLDLREIVSICATEYASGGDAKIEVDSAVPLPLLLLDAAQIQHLLRNLLQFFRGAADTDRPIAVSTSTTEGEVVLRVSARVKECERYELNTILESFASGKATGFALSLASVRRIVEAHGARIRCSTEPGQGLSIAVLFPAP